MKIELLDLTIRDLVEVYQDEGGKTDEEICQLLCRRCNREKAAS
ncbi:MAG: HNH endonuclease [Anaerolineaceae bacterium]|nr:HNH endonuclease [Anaerolineaceae bacterium]